MLNWLIIAELSEVQLLGGLRRRLEIAGPWFGRLKVPRRWSPVPQFPGQRRRLYGTGLLGFYAALRLVQVTGQKERTMLPLAVAVSVPLFAVIAYALLSHPHAPDAGPDHVS
jgi:hypothetical protein